MGASGCLTQKKTPLGEERLQMSSKCKGHQRASNFRDVACFICGLTIMPHQPIFARSSPRAAAKPVSKTVQSGFGLRPSEFYESSPDLL